MDEQITQEQTPETTQAQAPETTQEPSTKEVAKETANAVQNEQQVQPTPDDDIWGKIKTTRHRVKIDGQEKEVPYEELLTNYQLREASYKRFQEAKKQKEVADRFFESIQDPGKAIPILEQLYGKEQLLKLMEDKLANHLEYISMPEDQRRVIEKENALKTREQELLRKQKEQEQYQIKAQTNYLIQKFDRDIKAALEKANFPKEPRFVSQVARILSESKEVGVDMSIEDAIGVWESDMMNFQSYIASKLPHDRVLKYYPEDFVKGLKDHIRKSDIENIKSQTIKPRTEQSITPSDNAKKKMSLDEYLEFKKKNF